MKFFLPGFSSPTPEKIAKQDATIFDSMVGVVRDTTGVSSSKLVKAGRQIEGTVCA